MRLLVFFFALSVLTAATTKGQTISDSEFRWVKNKDCLPIGVCTQVFVKVEQDPVLTQFNKSEFDNLFRDIVSKLSLNKTLNGIIKLKLLFATDQNLCVAQTGTKSIELSTVQVDKISKRLSVIHEFELGKQRSKQVDCLGIFYVEVANGELSKTRNVNFNFE